MQFWVKKTCVAGRHDRQQGEFAFGAVLWKALPAALLETINFYAIPQ